MRPALRRIQLAIALAAIGTGVAPVLAHAYTPEQQQLCSDDAMRLCSEFVPDVDRIAACMQKQYSQLSKGCKTVFNKTGKAEASAASARR